MVLECAEFWFMPSINIFQIKRVFKSGINRELGISERFAAGSLAGAISQTVIYPMEVSILLLL